MALAGERKSRQPKNRYTHDVDTTELRVPNCEPGEFRARVANIRYRGYEVEKLADGRSIVITKPGGKISYGRVAREDFMVWVRNHKTQEMWLISHKDIYEDLARKAQAAPRQSLALFALFESVFEGADPDNVLVGVRLNQLPGEPAELLLKAYKWIWGQEDINYPTGEGRLMSMKAIRQLAEDTRISLA